MYESYEAAGHAANRLAKTYRHEAINATCQTLFYGIYLCLFPIAIHVMFANGLRSRARKWLLALLTTFVFALSTVYWILSVILTSTLSDLWNCIVWSCHGIDYVGSDFVLSRLSVGLWSEILGNILFINFIFADAVIVWRALALCSDQSRIVLMIPVAMLVINTLIYLMMVAVTAVVRIPESGVNLPVRLINILADTLLTHLALSLLINIYATSIITLKAWKYRKLLMEGGIGIRTPRQAIRILAVLVESGVIYILMGDIIFSIFIFLHFSWSSVFMPVAQQLVAIYPVVIVLLVERNRSFDSTISSFGTITDVRGRRRPSQAAEPLSFARRPVLASRGQLDLWTNLSNTDIHVTFDHALEPGGAGMSPGGSKDSDSIEDHPIF